MNRRRFLKAGLTLGSIWRPESGSSRLPAGLLSRRDPFQPPPGPG